MEDLDVRDCAAGARLTVRVKPRASKSRLVGVRGGALEVAVAAAPVDGAANAALIAWVSEALGVAKSAVALVSGESSRVKVLNVAGLSATAVRAALRGARAG